MGKDLGFIWILSRVSAIFFLIGFGVIAKVFGILKDEARSSLSGIVIYITAPALIFSTMSGDISVETLQAGWTLPILGMVLILIGFAMSKLYTRRSGLSSDYIRVFQVLCMMPNTTFMGYPVNYAIFGEQGLICAVLYDIGASILIWTLSIYLLSGGGEEGVSWRNVVNPAIIAVIAGLTVRLLNITVPEVILEPLRIMGAATTPLAMLQVGSRLMESPDDVASLKGSFVSLSVIRLLIMPGIAFALGTLLNLAPLVKGVLILETAMPSMASTPILAEKYGGDPKYAAAGVFITTLLSLLTIPAVIYFLA